MNTSSHLNDLRRRLTNPPARFFFFWCSDAHSGPGVSPSRNRSREHRGEMPLRTGCFAALCGTPWCAEARPQLTRPRGRATRIPTKTPLAFGQLAGSAASSIRQLLQVPFTVEASSAFFWNLEIVGFSSCRIPQAPEASEGHPGSIAEGTETTGAGTGSCKSETVMLGTVGWINDGRRSMSRRNMYRHVRPTFNTIFQPVWEEQRG